MTEPDPELVDDELEDLLPDDLQPVTKGRAVPVRRTKKQIADAHARAEKQALEAAENASAVQLAQIINLHIAGLSLADIGVRIGATADEVDRLLARDAQRYVRNQPALRVYVRNYVSEKYSTLLESVWEGAKDPNDKFQLEKQDRAVRILDRMTKLHGAEAPTQSEVTVDAAPETVERMVAALAAKAGQGYDMDVFDSDDDDIEDAVLVDPQAIHEAASEALEVSGNRVQDGDEEF